MKILVSAASRHGSTTEIATRIAGTIRAGLSGDTVVEVVPAVNVGDVTPYDAFVLGSSIYLGRWLKGAWKLAERVAAQRRPMWLFSSGPIGDPAEPADEPAEIGDLVKTTGARAARDR